MFNRFLEPNSATGYSNMLTVASGDTLDFVVGRGADGAPDHSCLKVQAVITRVTNAPPPPTNCVPVPADLVAWWPGEGNAQDRVDGHRGVLQGGVAFQTGEVGRGFAFHAPTSGVRVAAAPALDVGAGIGMTVELWINPDDVTHPAPLVEWNNGVDLWGAQFWVFANQSGSGLQPASHAVAGPAQLYAAFTLLGQWYQMVTDAGVLTPHVFQHVALTYDKSTGIGRIYRNGVLVAGQTLGSFTPQTAYDVYLGLRPAGPPGNPVVAYQGLMDEVAIYRRALSPAEIASIYHAGAAGKCASPDVLDQLVARVLAAPLWVNQDPLLASLNACRQSLERANLLAAINQLRAFQNKVDAQVRPRDPMLASALFALAQEVIESLDPGGVRRTELGSMTGRPMLLRRGSPLTGAGIRVEAWAFPGISCAMQRSTNLYHWVDAGTPEEISDGIFQLVDPNPAWPSSFYRLMVP